MGARVGTNSVMIIPCSEIFLNVLNMKKQFEFADTDKSNSISAKEMANAVQHLNLKISPNSIAPVIQLFDDNGTCDATILLCSVHCAFVG